MQWIFPKAGAVVSAPFLVVEGAAVKGDPEDLVMVFFFWLVDAVLLGKVVPSMRILKLLST